MKLFRPGAGLGKLIFSPVAVIAMLALVTTVALAAPPPKTHPPKDQPSASATVDVSESPDVDESDDPDASPGACNAVNGNAPQVIKDLVTNWPTKHDKGDKTRDVPPGLQKVADRLAACLGEDWDASPSPAASTDPDASPSPIIVNDEGTVIHAGKAVGLGHKH